MKIERGVNVFTLPGEEDALNQILNDESIDVMDKVITACPKEGIILYLVEYEKTRM